MGEEEKPRPLRASSEGAEDESKGQEQPGTNVGGSPWDFGAPFLWIHVFQLHSPNRWVTGVSPSALWAGILVFQTRKPHRSPPKTGLSGAQGFQGARKEPPDLTGAGTGFEMGGRGCAHIRVCEAVTTSSELHPWT